MKIDKAIETLETLEEHHVLKSWAQSRDAIKLLVEAGKRIEANRVSRAPVNRNLLPGETK